MLSRTLASLRLSPSSRNTAIACPQQSRARSWSPRWRWYMAMLFSAPACPARSPDARYRPSARCADDGARFARAVAEPLEQPRGLVELGAPVLITALEHAGPARAAARVRLAGQVPGPERGAEGHLLEVSQLIPAPAPGQEGLQRPRQLPRLPGEPGARSERHHLQQDQVLGLRPG